LTAFFEGALAGYGIAIPVGAIAVLIIEISLRQGFRSGFLAGAGAATADLIYASVAMIAGSVIAAALEEVARPIQVASGLLVIGIGVYGLWNLRRSGQVERVDGISTNSLGIYGRFLLLTLLNPMTIVYFSALIIGGGVSHVDTIFSGFAFVLGAALASLSWQTLLAGVGAVGHERLSPRVRVITGLIGYCVVVGFGVRILLTL
jgi:threonine/homoserine/homoserine lactone efflux protein